MKGMKMKFYCKPPKGPRHGDIHTIRKFLLWPRHNPQDHTEIRWLEWITIEQKYVEYRASSISDQFWRDIRFVDGVVEKTNSFESNKHLTGQEGCMNAEIAPWGENGIWKVFGCYCRECNLFAPSWMMIICPTCGNKHCPKANNHQNSCTNSNEPDQLGIDY